MLYELVRRGVVGTGVGHAGGHRQEDVAFVEGEGLRQGYLDPVGGCVHPVLELVERGSRHQEDELVGTEATEELAWPGQALDAIGEHAQKGVAGTVTEAVVDHLEAVQVDEHDSRAAVFASQELVEVADDHGPVGKPGEGVVVGLMLEGGVAAAAVQGDGHQAGGPFGHRQLLGHGWIRDREVAGHQGHDLVAARCDHRGHPTGDHSVGLAGGDLFGCQGPVVFDVVHGDRDASLGGPGEEAEGSPAVDVVT